MFELRRRRFLAATFGMAAFWQALSVAGAKAKRLAIVSVVGDETAELFAPVLGALASRGYRRDGRDANLVVTFFTRDAGRLDGPTNDDVARAAVESAPDAILTISTQTTAALRQRTRSIPIVTSVGDPVGSGFAESIARPGGNITGLSQGFKFGVAKGIEAIRALVPDLRRLAIFHSPGPVGVQSARAVAQVAEAVRISPHRIPVIDDGDARRGLEGLRRAGVNVGCWLISGADPHAAAEHAIRLRIPLVSIGGDMTDAGMLASFYTSIPNLPDRLAAITARVLNGENPATVPFELPSEFNIFLNLRTARAIGLTIPAELRVRANGVLE